MKLIFLLRCYGLGVLSTLGIGPIFILTFNRGAVYGFLHGFFTALGSCIADAILFALGLLGILAIVQQSHNTIIAMDLFGGVLLIKRKFGLFGKLFKHLATKRKRYLL